MGATSSKEPWEEDIESGGSPAGDLTPEQEIERVLRFQNNYYKVLKQDPSTCTSASLKKAYYKLARVLHPDKCSDPRATQAMGVVTSAHSTLSNTSLRMTYDLYMSQNNTDSASSDSFAEWESKGGAQAQHLPPWLVKALANPILGPIIQFFLSLFVLLVCLLILALMLVYFVVHMVFWFLCCFGCCGHCWPRYGEGARLHEIQMRRSEQMFKDFEAECMMAQAQGKPMPDLFVFMRNWQIAHPEEADGGAHATNQYGSVS